MSYEVAAGIAAIVGVGLLYLVGKTRKRLPNEPHYLRGNWLLGVGLSLAKDAVGFLRGVNESYGDVVTMKILYLNMTFFLNPHDYERLLKEKNFDYHLVKAQAVWRLFGAWTTDIKKHLNIIARGIRGPAMERGTVNFSKKLSQVCSRVGSETGSEEWKEDTVAGFTSKTMFAALHDTFFDVYNGDPGKALSIFQNFNVHRQFFNYLWLGIPKAFFPSARHAVKVLHKQPSPDELLKRAEIPEFLRGTINFMKEAGQTDGDIKRNTTMMLYTNYNVTRLSTWVLYFVMKNEKARKAVVEEIDDWLAKGEDAFTLTEIETLPVVESIVQETFRLVGGALIVRKVTKDVNFESHNGETHFLRAGDHVAMYPAMTHNDPEVFADPQEFKYDRFIDAKFFKNGEELRSPVNTLGSCPARRFTAAHLKLFLISILMQFDVQLVKDVAEHKYEFPDEVRTLNDKVTMRFKAKGECEGEKRKNFALKLQFL